LFNDLLILFAILILLVEIYRKLRQIWLRHLLSEKKKARRPRKPPILRSKSERGNLPRLALVSGRQAETEDAGG
jgi:hypothetical protein